MADTSFLDWPFFDDAHRALAEDVRAWATAEVAPHDEGDVDAAARGLVRRLGAAATSAANVACLRFPPRARSPATTTPIEPPAKPASASGGSEVGT